PSPPAAAQPATIAGYLTAPVRAPALPASGPLVFRVLSRVFGLLTRDLSRVHGHSFRNVDVSPQQRSYPVVIMRAGASLEVWNYSTLAEDLASHGSVAVDLDDHYRT